MLSMDDAHALPSDALSMEDMLMRNIAKGDEASFNALYDLWARRVMVYAYRSLRNTDDAQDVVQETFTRLYSAAPSYRTEGKFPSFLLRIAGNIVRMRFRGARQVDSIDEIDEEGGAVPSALSYAPEESLISVLDLESSLGMLPERQREALLLTADGYTYSEGAELMGIGTEAFAQLVFRGRRALRALLM